MHPFRKIKHRKELPIYIKEAGYKIICEVGVRAGINFHNMLKSDPVLAIAVDAWRSDGNINRSYGLDQQYFDKLYDEFQESVTENVDIRRGYSFDVVEQFKDGFFDFIYVDADHSYEAVKRDIMDWYPKVRDGGIISGHDYRNAGDRKLKLKFEVAKAVNEFVKNKKLEDRFFTSKEENPSWFIIV